ncbi:MAG: nickel pincer cofactor biosynthesis protein LarB [Acidimicrobiales bacterium]|nr:nickel pincer cofactor biosynthesis protein LarB [Acidimicrobiales bacterium]
MDESALLQLLDDVRSGACTAEDAVRRLRRLPFADLGFARVDHHRWLRQGLPEAVYGQGKTPEQCSAIVGELLAGAGWAQRGHGPGAGSSRAGDPEAGGDPGAVLTGPPVVLTRADRDQVELAMATHDGGTRTHTGLATGADRTRGELSTVVWRSALPRPGRVMVVTAGTTDLSVASECAATLRGLGLAPVVIPDCGVAGVHRLLATVDELADVDVVVVVAGMEGALASLVGGITPAPVVAVPTSTGYGSGLEGVTALLAMTASCAAGVTVVGIDNGFGAACAVARILP